MTKTGDDDGLVPVTPDGKSRTDGKTGAAKKATKRGTAAAAKKALAKPAKAAKGKPEPAGPIQGKELVKRAMDGDEGARKALIKFLTCFERWKKALGDQREENRKAGELEGGRLAALENAMESGLPTNPSGDEVLDKLRTAEGQWQEWQEAKAQAGEMRSVAKDLVKKRAGELERAASDSAQLTIPGTD